MVKDEEIRALEEAHKISMLLYLLDHGRSKKTDIYSAVPHNTNSAKKLDDLKNIGLITLETRRFENNATFVELTDKGLKVAKKLREISNILSDSDVGSEPENNYSTPEKIRVEISK